MSVQLEISSGLIMGLEIWDCQLTTRGLKLGFQKGVILAAHNEQKLGVSPMVYLHAGLEIGSAIPHPIHQESNEDTHALGSQRSSCHSAWCQSKLDPHLPKWQNRPSRSTVQGRKPWRFCPAKP